MKSRMLKRALAVIALSVLLCGPGWIYLSQTANGSTQAKTGRAVELPKARHTSKGAQIDDRLFVVSIPAEGEFYVGSRKLTKEILAATIRDSLPDRRPDEQRVYARCAASLSFGAVRQLLNVMRQVGYDTVEFIVEDADSRREVVIEAQIVMPNGLKEDPNDFIDVPPRPREKTSRPAPPPLPPPPPASARVVQVGPPIALDTDSLVVELNSGAPAIALNRIGISLPELSSTLSKILESRPDRAVLIKPSREITYADFIEIADESLGAGAEPLGILIDEVKVPRGIPRPRRVPGVETDEPGIVRQSGGAFQQSAIRTVEPISPKLAKQASVTGAVIVEVTVDERGDVILARAVMGHPLLKDAAVEAARGWKFKPFRLKGGLVKVVGTLTFNFK